MKDELKKLKKIELFAWLGEDEYGSGRFGLKQGIAPAGIIPIVAVDFHKVEAFAAQFEAQAAKHGKRIYLIRFEAVEVLRATEHGEPEV